MIERDRAHALVLDSENIKNLEERNLLVLIMLISQPPKLHGSQQTSAGQTAMENMSSIVALVGPCHVRLLHSAGIATWLPHCPLDLQGGWATCKPQGCPPLIRQSPQTQQQPALFALGTCQTQHPLPWSSRVVMRRAQLPARQQCGSQM